MNEHLNIPAEVQTILNSINEVPLYLAEIPMSDHPKLPQFDRFIRVTDIDVKSKNEFAVFKYEQILKDKDTNEIVNIPLPTPEWVVYKDTWSYLRDEHNQTIEPGLIDPESYTPDMDTKIRVPSFKYMLWLLKNDRIGLLELITSYLESFKQAKLSELDTL